MKNENSSDRSEARQILFHGGIMTLLGLLSGFTAYFAASPTIALQTHTIGLMQGIMLIAIAGAWHLLNISPKSLKIIKYTLIIGFYLNWISMQLSAFWNAGKDAFPVTGKDMPDNAVPWQNLTVMVLGFFTVLIIVSAIFIILAARKKNSD